MCGRYTLLAKEEEILNYFGIADPLESYEPSYNIAPGQNVLAVIHDGQRKRIGPLRWGLVPSWAKDEKIGYRMINARLETAHEKPSFRQLMAQKRCLIIADSFYEWQTRDDVKQPQRIQVKNRQLFTFAGLWDKWEKDGQILFTCTMLTKESNDFMKNIHHRMPIILPENKEDDWIQPFVQRPIEAKQFLEEVADETLTAYPVSTHVNKATNNDPTCVEPIR